MALTVAGILALAILGGGVARWAIEAQDDPLESAPELKLGVFDYMLMPTVGQSHRAGDVEVVLFAVVPLDEGGWALHFVLRSESGLDRYRTRLVPTGGDHTQATCSASGSSGWGECYVEVPASLGRTVDFQLWRAGDVVGDFRLDFSALP